MSGLNFNDTTTKSATVAGSNTEIQFNNDGVVDADPGLTYDKASEHFDINSITRFGVTDITNINWDGGVPGAGDGPGMIFTPPPGAPWAFFGMADTDDNTPPGEIGYSAGSDISTGEIGNVNGGNLNLMSGGIYGDGSGNPGVVNIVTGKNLGSSGNFGAIALRADGSTVNSGFSHGMTNQIQLSAPTIYLDATSSIVLTTDILSVPTTVTGGGTTGNQTINKISGTVNFAASASSLTVTNSFVGVNSLVFAVVRTNDATAVIKNVVPADGSFVINLTANTTAETSVGFFVINGS